MEIKPIVKSLSWINWRQPYDADKNLVIIMVGLPARGKTFIALRLSGYLRWKDYKINWFNNGNYRRKIFGKDECGTELFDPDNKEGIKKRKECCVAALTDMVKYLKGNGEIGILDATNTTLERRIFIKKFLDKYFRNYQLLWIESIITD